MREYAQIIGNEFRPQGYKIPSKNLPKPLVWVGKLFIPTLKAVYSTLGKRVQYSNERMVSELGIQPRPVEESIIDTCYSLVELGLAKKTPGYLGHPSTRPPPPQTEAPKEEATAVKDGDQPSQEKPAETKTTEVQPASEDGQKGEDKPTETEKSENEQASEEGQKSEEDKPAETEAQPASEDSQRGEDKPTETEKSEDQQASEDGQKSEEDKPADAVQSEAKPTEGETRNEEEPKAE